jgi:hypothetical protein
MTNTRQIEMRIEAQIIDAALAKGCTVSVSDGEDWTVNLSRHRNAILDAIGTTGETVLAFRDKNNQRIGFVHLVHGNGAEVIHDYTDKPEIDAILKDALSLSEAILAA